MSERRDFTGQVAIVTGAGGGIGRRTLRALCSAGFTAIGFDLNEQLLEEAVGETGSNSAHFRVVDVTEAEQVRKTVDEVAQKFGRIDLLVNNAGLFRAIGATWELPPETWKRDVEVNLFGTFSLCRAVIPVMRRQTRGVIVNLDGGGGANSTNPGGSAYAASKAAVVRLTETLARELEREAPVVIVFAMNPGLTRTGMTERLAGSQWQKFVREAFETGTHRNADWCGNTLLELLSVAGPHFSGRTFDEEVIPSKVDAHRRSLVSQELYVMRTRRLEDISWRRLSKVIAKKLLAALPDFEKSAVLGTRRKISGPFMRNPIYDLMKWPPRK